MATTIIVQGVEDVGGVKRKVNLTLSVADVNVGYPQFGDVPGTVGVVPGPLTPVPEPVPGD